jgi:hypothetical protein
MSSTRAADNIVDGTGGHGRRAGVLPPIPVYSHGWDAPSQSWRGPDELTFTLQNSRPLLRKLRSSKGAWYGKVGCRLPGERPASFCTSIHDLGDSAVALIDVEDSNGSPAEVVAVIPNHRIPSIRPDFAFEFVTFLRFVRAAEVGSELPIHDYVERTLQQAGRDSSLVFSIGGTVSPEMDLALSVHVERLVMCILQWLSEKDHGATRLKLAYSHGRAV